MKTQPQIEQLSLGIFNCSPMKFEAIIVNVGRSKAFFEMNAKQADIKASRKLCNSYLILIGLI